MTVLIVALFILFPIKFRQKPYLNWSNFSNVIQDGMMMLGIETLDRVLALLMGDNFATPIPVSELKAKYGYPEMSDSELDELIVDMW